MAKKRYSDGGVLSTEGAKKAGEDAAWRPKLDRMLDRMDVESAMSSMSPDERRRTEILRESLRKKTGPDAAISGYKKGGKVKSASSRADGIAQRGKTRGKIY